MVLTVFPTVSTAQRNGTVIRVEPAEVTLGPDPYPIGEQFTVNVTLYNVAGLYGWEAKLFWDNTILSAIEDVVQVPSGYNWEDPNNFKLGAGIQQDYNATHGRWYRGLTPLLMAEPHPIPFDGTALLVTITFNVTGLGETKLDLQETKLSDYDANPIPHTAEDGYVEILSAPVCAPRIWIEPRDSTAYTGYVFVVDVMISVQAACKLVAVEFKLGFDPILLEVVAITEGPFMKDPRWALEGTYMLGPTIEENSVVVGILLIPDVEGPPAEWTAFPDGGGTLATVTLKGKAEGSCALELSAKLANSEIESIDHVTADGFVTVIEVIVSPDVNGDGVVDVFDIVAAALAFGSYPGHPRWNPVADLNLDNVIDIYDLVAIALNLGTYM